MADKAISMLIDLRQWDEAKVRVEPDSAELASRSRVPRSMPAPSDSSSFAAIASSPEVPLSLSCLMPDARCLMLDA